MLSCVRLFVTPWTVARQAPLFIGFSRQKYWRGLLFPSLGDLTNPGIEPRSPTLQTDSLPTEPPASPLPCIATNQLLLTAFVGIVGAERELFCPLSRDLCDFSSSFFEDPLTTFYLHYLEIPRRSYKSRSFDCLL